LFFICFLKITSASSLALMEAIILLHLRQANAIDSSEQQETLLTEKSLCFAPNYFTIWKCKVKQYPYHLQVFFKVAKLLRL